MATAEVDLLALRHNAGLLKNTVGDFYAVLKCGAYGHGDTECAEALYSEGIRKYAVYDLSEALRIKRCVGESEILILGKTPEDLAGKISENGFVQSAGSAEYLEKLALTGEKIKIHLETESGMNRSGFEKLPEKIFSDKYKNLEIPGIFTHFPDADAEDTRRVKERFYRFRRTCAEAEKTLGRKLVKHCAASAAALRFPEMREDACRIGLALYGLCPDNSFLAGLLPVMRLSGRVLEVKNVKKGESVGYGCDFVAKRDVITVTVDAGYSDGLFRGIYKSFKPCFRGKRVSFAGKICMDRCMLDVTDVIKTPVKIGEKADFILSAGDVSEMAKCAGTIPYEILTSLSSARERIYKK